MTITQRDRRALVLLGVAVAAILVFRLVVARDQDAPAAVAVSAGSLPLAEKRLAKLRQTAAALQGKEELLKKAAEEVAVREKGLILAETAAQAQAQLLQVVRRIGNSEGVSVRGGEMGPIRNLGEDYGEVTVAVTFECRIEQLVNLLSAIANEPQLLATNSVRVSSANPKEKTVNVRLELGGAVPQQLVPERKATF
jgi:hypothetical protein